ncbi:hypothetical protein [Bradyrhizobium sp. CB3481]|uniref:hypothetical protein n=1 Tax=Bradyrhizobium sp. CB3481 TaxID=3039158 RepID=UPI0024B22BB9|nr:hypothetical protein [Bradyrhizobium sp. CB3481]WFU14837.1 hypothetical protein QA643_27845 [Bradyrhizobium sp. CB3481]
MMRSWSTNIWLDQLVELILQPIGLNLRTGDEGPDVGQDLDSDRGCGRCVNNGYDRDSSRKRFAGQRWPNGGNRWRGRIARKR